VESQGVFVVSWPRDRFGWIQAFRSENLAGCLNREARPPHRVITCPIQITHGTAHVFLNVDGLGEHSHLQVRLLDEGFRPVPGCEDPVAIMENGLRVPVRWKGASALEKKHGRVRLDIQFEGIRPEDAKLYAAYVSHAGNDAKA
jgi:hypothetical protein